MSAPLSLMIPLLLSYPTEDAVAAERTRNEKAFLEEYLPRKEALFEKAAGKWLVIANGQLLWHTPVPTIQDAELLGRKCAPYAKHRFIFRVGEEGDVAYSLGGTREAFVVGSAFFSATPGWTIDVGGETIDRNGVKVGQTRLPVEAAAPVGTAVGDGKKFEFLAATGFEGFLAMPRQAADSLSLQLWEIPGTTHLRGFPLSGQARRARVEVRISRAVEEWIVPVAIWD